MIQLIFPTRRQKTWNDRCHQLISLTFQQSKLTISFVVFWFTHRVNVWQYDIDVATRKHTVLSEEKLVTAICIYYILHLAQYTWKAWINVSFFEKKIRDRVYIARINRISQESKHARQTGPWWHESISISVRFTSCLPLQHAPRSAPGAALATRSSSPRTYTARAERELIN